MVIRTYGYFPKMSVTSARPYNRMTLKPKKYNLPKTSAIHFLACKVTKNSTINHVFTQILTNNPGIWLLVLGCWL